jgi:hypothetical protein
MRQDVPCLPCFTPSAGFALLAVAVRLQQGPVQPLVPVQALVPVPVLVPAADPQ